MNRFLEAANAASACAREEREEEDFSLAKMLHVLMLSDEELMTRLTTTSTILVDEETPKTPENNLKNFFLPTDRLCSL